MNCGTTLRDSGAHAVTQKPHWPAKRESHGTVEQACSNVVSAARSYCKREIGALMIGPRMTVRLILKVCSVAALVAIVIFALGPAKWTPRSGLGFEFDHFVGYFFFTLLFCRGRRSPRGLGGGSGKLAIFSTGSLILLCGSLVQCCRCPGGGLDCRVLHASTEAVSI